MILFYERCSRGHLDLCVGLNCARTDRGAATAAMRMVVLSRGGRAPGWDALCVRPGGRLGTATRGSALTFARAKRRQVKYESDHPRAGGGHYEAAGGWDEHAVQRTSAPCDCVRDERRGAGEAHGRSARRQLPDQDAPELQEP